MTLKQLGISLLRLLIGIGFTFSLVLGATLTMLALFHGPGDNLVLNRPSPDWGWGGGAAIAWALTLFWWICWRCLPAVKPAGLFLPLERSLQKSPSLFGIILSAIGTTACICFALGLGLRLAAHMAGASWPYFLYWCFLAVTNGFGTLSGWKQWRSRRRTKTFVNRFYYD